MELRVQWPAGQATFFLTQEEALKAAVALRRLGLGLTFQKGRTMITTETAKFTAVETELRRMRSGGARR